MKTYKKTAVLVGVFFIIGTASGVLSMMLIGSFLDDPEYLTVIAANGNRVVLGAICILTMGFALTMIPVLLYPLFKRINQVLAMGSIIFRGALEAAIYISQAVLWLLLLSVSRNYVVSGSNEISALQSIGALFISADAWLANILSIVFSLGAVMIYWVFIVSRLIPRWLSIWGLVGGILYFLAPIAGLYELELGFLMFPLAVQEMVMSVWLIIKGFDKGAIAYLMEQ